MSINDIRETLRGEKKDFTEVIKSIGGTAVNVGVDMVIGALLAAGLCQKKGLKRAVGCLGIMVLSMKIGEVAEDHFCSMVDDLKEAFGKAKTEIEEAEKEEEDDDEE